MERERPDYLPPIKQQRWTFPWLTFWAIALGLMAAAGVGLHLKTNEAWSERFSKSAAQRFEQTKKLANPAALTGKDGTPDHASAGRDARLADLRLRREAAEREANSQRNGEEARTRCIHGTLFRAIPGGWENIPGRTCSP